MNFGIENIILILISIISYNISTKYRLYENFNNKKTIRLVNPPKFESDLKINNKQLLTEKKFREFINEIITFKCKLEKQINKKYLYNMYNNLKTLKAKEKIILPQNLLLILASGSYNPKNNKIKILKLFKNEVIYHELFHMASTPPKSNKKTHISGFLQYNIIAKDGFGIALNEGFTELLASRHFKQNDCVSNTYKLCKFYSIRLEEIIGKDLMLKLYLTGDLPGLIKELRIYDTKENIIKFISNLDFVFNTMSILLNPIIINKKKLKEKIILKLSEINNMLIKWYIKMKHNELKDNKISNLDFMKDIKSYHNSIVEYEYFYKNKLKLISLAKYRESEKLEISTKEIESYPQVKIIKKRYDC